MLSPVSSLGFYPVCRALGVGEDPLASLLQMLCVNCLSDSSSLAHSCSLCVFTASLDVLRGLLGRITLTSDILGWGFLCSSSQPDPICFLSYRISLHFWSIVGFNYFLALLSFHSFKKISSLSFQGDSGQEYVWLVLHLKSTSSLFTRSELFPIHAETNSLKGLSHWKILKFSLDKKLYYKD